jgi:PST family polysaccharide transporter
LSFILFAIGEPLTVLLLGDRWRTAGRVLAALCGLGAGMALISIASTALKSSGRPDLLTRLNVIWATLTLALAVALLPLGVVGVGAATSASSAAAAAYALRAAGRVVGVRRQSVLRAIWPPVVAAGITSVAVASLEHFVLHAANRSAAAGFMLLALEIVVSAFSYLAIMAVLARPMIGEALLPIRLALGRAAIAPGQ